jgi:hypothetical protein
MVSEERSEPPEFNSALSLTKPDEIVKPKVGKSILKDAEAKRTKKGYPPMFAAS